MVSHRHTNGNGIYLPAASTSAMFSTTNSIVVVSNSQKQSVSDASQNVVLPPRSRSDIPKKPARREFASAKVQIPLQLLTILLQIITFIRIQFMKTCLISTCKLPDFVWTLGNFRLVLSKFAHRKLIVCRENRPVRASPLRPMR